ncbi:MAG: hypothetical protein U0793_28750 [Gemmataceae bacterium]
MQIAVGNVDQTISFLYNADDGKLEHKLDRPRHRRDGRRLQPERPAPRLARGRQPRACLGLAKPGTPLVLSGHTGPLLGPPSATITSTLSRRGADQTVRLWKLEGSAFKERRFPCGHKDWVANVAFSKDGYFVAPRVLTSW